MSQTEANARPDTLRRVGRPTIGDERNEVLRRLLREIRAQEFDDNLSATARAIGVEPGTLSDFLNEKRGAGTKIMDGLTKHLRRGMDQIIAGGGDLGALRGQSSPTPLSRQVTFGDLPNWPGLLAAAKTQRPSHALWVWEQLAQARVWLDGAVTPSLVADCSDVVARHVAPPAPLS